jgi:hypothetical protein
MKTNAWKCFMMFPLHDNHGEPFTAELWNWWRDELTLTVTGFTETGEVRGWWQGQSDLNRTLFVITTDTKKIGEIREFIREAGVRMRQKSMYFEFHETHFEEVPGLMG